MLNPPPCCESAVFAGGVFKGAVVFVSTARVGAGVGVTTGAGGVRFAFDAAAVDMPSALEGVVGLGVGDVMGAAALPFAGSFLLTLRDWRDAVRGRSASPPPRTASPGVFVLARATSAGVGVGRAMLSVGRAGVGVALATVAAGVGCAVGDWLAEDAAVCPPPSLFAV